MISILRMIEMNGDRNEFPARVCFPLPQKRLPRRAEPKPYSPKQKEVSDHHDR